MKLKTTSWHARYYRWAALTQLPNNLCNYFWGLLGLIVVSPILFVICIPELIGLIFKKVKYNLDNGTMLWYNWDDRKWNNVIPYLGLGILFLIGLAFYRHPWISSYVVGCIALIILVAYFITKEMKNKKHATKKEKEPNILFEFIKAKKEKYCPRIEWVSKDSHEGEVVK